MSDLQIRRGGLMRCCINTIAHYNGEEEPGRTVLTCQYHTDPKAGKIRLGFDSVWEWAR